MSSNSKLKTNIHNYWGRSTQLKPKSRLIGWVGVWMSEPPHLFIFRLSSFLSLPVLSPSLPIPILLSPPSSGHGVLWIACTVGDDEAKCRSLTELLVECSTNHPARCCGFPAFPLSSSSRRTRKSSESGSRVWCLAFALTRSFHRLDRGSGTRTKIHFGSSLFGSGGQFLFGEWSAKG